MPDPHRLLGGVSFKCDGSFRGASLKTP
ncbi:hypothetical protein VCHE16_0250, partial [Vibrio paracholerae HE-16]